MSSRVFADPFINGGAVLRIPTPTVTIHSDDFTRANTVEGAGIGSPVVGNAYSLVTSTNVASLLGRIYSNAFTVDGDGTVYAVSQYTAATIPSLISATIRWDDTGSGGVSDTVYIILTQDAAAGSVLGERYIGLRIDPLGASSFSKMYAYIPDSVGVAKSVIGPRNTNQFPLALGVDHLFELIIPSDGSAVVATINGQVYSQVTDSSAMVEFSHWMSTSGQVRMAVAITHAAANEGKASFKSLVMKGNPADGSDGVYTPDTSPGIIT